MEDENTMVFVVDTRATKPQIKRAFKALHGETVKSVNVINKNQQLWMIKNKKF